MLPIKEKNNIYEKICYIIKNIEGKSTCQKKGTVLIPEHNHETRFNLFLPPDQVMDAVGVKLGMAVSMIGAGREYCIVRLDVRLGDTGNVKAEDFNSDLLRYMEGD